MVDSDKKVLVDKAVLRRKLKDEVESYRELRGYSGLGGKGPLAREGETLMPLNISMAFGLYDRDAVSE